MQTHNTKTGLSTTGNSREGLKYNYHCKLKVSNERLIQSFNTVSTRACEQSGKRRGAGRKSGGAERGAGVAENDGVGAERGAGREAEAGTERGAG